MWEEYILQCGMVILPREGRLLNVGLTKGKYTNGTDRCLTRIWDAAHSQSIHFERHTHVCFLQWTRESVRKVECGCDCGCNISESRQVWVWKKKIYETEKEREFERVHGTECRCVSSTHKHALRFALSRGFTGSGFNTKHSNMYINMYIYTQNHVLEQHVHLYTKLHIRYNYGQWGKQANSGPA